MNPQSNPTKKSLLTCMENPGVSSTGKSMGVLFNPSCKAHRTSEDIDPPAAEATRGRLSIRAVNQNFSVVLYIYRVVSVECGMWIMSNDRIYRHNPTYERKEMIYI